jgi:hypothetical protein
VKPGKELLLKQYDPDDTGDYKKNEQGKEKAKRRQRRKRPRSLPS